MSDEAKAALEKEIAAREAERTKAQASPATTASTPPSTAPAPVPAPPKAAVPAVQGPYAIYYAADCFQPLDSSNLADGSIFKGIPCANVPVQQFNLEMKDGGYFRIVNKSSSKCLILQGNTMGEGTPPTLRPCKAVADNSEQWHFFEAAADGSSVKMQSRLSGFCLKIGTDGTIFQGNCANNYTILMLRKTP